MTVGDLTDGSTLSRINVNAEVFRARGSGDSFEPSIHSLGTPAALSGVRFCRVVRGVRASF